MRLSAPRWNRACASRARITGARAHVSSAYLTFVAQDEHGRPVDVPPLVLEDEEDRRRERDARQRRAIRLERAKVKRERLAAETRERG